MKNDFIFVGFVNLPWNLRGRLAACPEMLKEIIKTNNGIWDCPRCHMHIESIGKPTSCTRCEKKI